MDGSQPDHNGRSRCQHRHLSRPRPLLPHSHRDGPLVDNLLLRSRPLYLPDIGRHWREAGPEDQDQQPSGGVVWPRLRQSEHGVCQHCQLLCREARPLPRLDVVPGKFVTCNPPASHWPGPVSVSVCLHFILLRPLADLRLGHPHLRHHRRDGGTDRGDGCHAPLLLRELLQPWHLVVQCESLN